MLLATKAEKDGESSPEIVLISPREATEEAKTQAWQDAQSWWKTHKAKHRLECQTNCEKSGSAEPESAGDPVALEEHQVDVARHLRTGSPILGFLTSIFECHQDDRPGQSHEKPKQLLRINFKEVSLPTKPRGS